MSVPESADLEWGLKGFDLWAHHKPSIHHLRLCDDGLAIPSHSS